MRVTGIAYAGKADVYNMEVPGIHDFAVENGAIVHNCYDEVRYFCMGRAKPGDELKQERAKYFDPFREGRR